MWFKNNRHQNTIYRQKRPNYKAFIYMFAKTKNQQEQQNLFNKISAQWKGENSYEMKNNF